MPEPRLSRVRLAVVAMFFLNGILFGAWAARVPAFVEAFSLDPATLGRLLLCLAGGAILAFPLAGWLSDRIGADRATRWIGLYYALALPLIALAPNTWALAGALLLFGAGHGAMDVAMNGWGAEVERVYRRPILSSFHAMWSLGAGLGALSGGAAVALGLTPLIHFTLVAALLGGLTLWIALVPWESRRGAGGGVGFALPTKPLVLAGVVAFCSSIGEGAMADWSAVFLIDIAGTDEARAALGYSVYSAAMFVARISADRVIHRLGPVPTARVAGVLAFAGLAVALLGQTLEAGLAGFVLLGLGYSVVMPLAMSRAANDPDTPQGRAIAGVATLGYGGMVLGPALIGGIAHLAGLPVAFWLVAVLALGISALAKALKQP
ncbi:MFS transporter [Pararhodobacter sp. CCB-MM2]|uniref:MFS transporter n=1 Tax=Pararhodobacter sp. CCB-MM2 TaxID=1786003 RepID=UPI000835656F|nr:MFS transporter [Pararhodobacter sp. CCB-MM2]MCA2014104.1 MFS transporter [Cereibacter sphaeroides]